MLLTFFIVTSAAIAASSVQIGSPIPSVELPSTSGRVIDTFSYTGSPMLITFFSTWSKPCQENLVSIQQISERFKGLKVLAVSFVKKISAVNTFFNDNGINLTCLIDKKQKCLDTINILMIPTTFLVDKDGNLRKIYIDYDESYQKLMTSDINEMLAEKKAE